MRPQIQRPRNPMIPSPSGRPAVELPASPSFLAQGTSPQACCGKPQISSDLGVVLQLPLYLEHPASLPQLLFSRRKLPCTFKIFFFFF